jgi:hypothetical protein
LTLFPIRSQLRMALTKGEILRHGIAFALRSVWLAGRRLGLTEDDRMRIADETLRELRKHGEWRELDDVVDGGPAAAQPVRRDRRAG